MLATLPSNRGDSDFSIESVSASESSGERRHDAVIRLRGVHWDGDHTHPFALFLEGIWLRSAAPIALCEHIARWIEQPLERVIASELDAVFELTDERSQHVKIRFGSRSDTISDLNPVVSFGVSAGPLRSECHFVTDQSCLAIFRDELATVIQKDGSGIDT